MEREQYDFTYEDLNPKFLFSCLLERTEEEAKYHAHDFVELAVILKGKSLFCIDGEDCEVEEGNLILLNPGTYHKSVPQVSGGHGCVECYMAFTGIAWKGCGQGKMPLFKGNRRIIRMPDKMKQEMFRLCNAMDKETKSCDMGRYFMLKAYLIQVICLIAREQREEEQNERGRGYIFKSTGKKYVVQQIMKYMETHYREKISLDQIAENMYLSSFYISKIFKSETGDTPINYLISLRMEKAREILDQNPEESIQETAAAVGYEDAYHFSKLFKKYYGISPLYYKGRAKI